MRVQDRKTLVMSIKRICLFPFRYEFDVLEELERYCTNIIGILYCLALPRLFLLLSIISTFYKGATLPLFCFFH